MESYRYLGDMPGYGGIRHPTSDHPDISQNVILAPAQPADDNRDLDEPHTHGKPKKSLTLSPGVITGEDDTTIVDENKTKARKRPGDSLVNFQQLLAQNTDTTIQAATQVQPTDITGATTILSRDKTIAGQTLIDPVSVPIAATVI